VDRTITRETSGNGSAGADRGGPDTTAATRTPEGPDGLGDGLLEGLPDEIRLAIGVRPGSAPLPESGTPSGRAAHGRPGPPSVREEGLLAATLADTVLDCAEAGPLTVRAAAVRGERRRRVGDGRRTAVCVSGIGPGSDGLLLLAVAEAAGPAAVAPRGSHHAVRLAAHCFDPLAEALGRALRAGDEPGFAALAGRAVADCAAGLRRMAEAPAAVSAESDAGAWATTLRLLLVPLDPAVAVRGSVTVGGGGLFRLRDGRWRMDPPVPGGTEPVPAPDRGPEALPNAYEGVRARLLPPSEPGDLLMVCTGTLAGALPADDPLRARLTREWGPGSPVPGVAGFLAQVAPGGGADDLAVVCLWEGPDR
jgi:hypothetical protein